jgi:hypothetical protein
LIICADENVAPLLTKLIRESLLGKAHTLHTVDDHQAKGVDDEIWVRKFAKAGGEGVVGADARMLTRPHEVIAIAEAGLRMIVLPSQWVQQKKHLQIAFLFLWWPRIEKTFESCKARECFKVPWSWTLDGELAQVKVDFQDAYKKAKKAKG